MNLEDIGSPFGPYPSEINLRAFNCLDLGNLRQYVDREGEENSGANDKFKTILENVEKESKSKSENAHALIRIGDMILEADSVPTMKDPLVEEVLKRLFLIKELDVKLSAAFIVRVGRLAGGAGKLSCTADWLMLEPGKYLERTETFERMVRFLLKSLDSEGEDGEFAREWCRRSSHNKDGLEGALQEIKQNASEKKSPFAPKPGEDGELRKKALSSLREGTFEEMLDSLRGEYPNGEEYAHALISVGDSILDNMYAIKLEPEEANVHVGRVAGKLFELPEIDFEYAAAFLCRAHESIRPATRDKMDALSMERGWGIVGKPAFVAMTKNLLAALKSEKESGERQAEEYCIGMGVVRSDLEEIVVNAGIKA